MPFPDSRSSLKRRLGILHLVELGDGVLAMIARYGAEFVNGKTHVLSVRFQMARFGSLTSLFSRPYNNLKGHTDVYKDLPTVPSLD
jgi:hypothetical protein